MEEKVQRPKWMLAWGVLFFPAALVGSNYPGLWPLWVLAIVLSCGCILMAYRPYPAPVIAATPRPEPPRPQAYYSNRR